VNPEDSKKLDRILALAEENNAYIRKVRSVQKTSQMFKAIYWVVIITFVLGGFYFIQPYINTLTKFYSGVGSVNNSFLQGYDTKQLQDIVNQLKK
jgi:uncharacterized membrane protein